MTATATATNSQAAPHTSSDAETITVLRILLSLSVFFAGWMTSVALWGIPGLYIPALALVPVAWVALIAISRG